jgi:hypothetical protein
MCSLSLSTDRRAIAQQDRASLRGLLGQRAMLEFACADDMQSWRYLAG